MAPSRPALVVAWLVAAACWGASFLFIKWGLEGLVPGQVALARLLFGTLFLGGWLLVTRTPLPRDRATWGHFAVLGILFCFAPFTLFAYAETLVDSGLAAILNATTPLWTLVMVLLFLPAERVTTRKVVGLLVGFAGVVVVALPQVTGLGARDALLGQAACLAATACYGGGLVWVRRFVIPRGVGPLVIAFGQVSMGLDLVRARLAAAVLGAGGAVVAGGRGHGRPRRARHRARVRPQHRRHGRARGHVRLDRHLPVPAHRGRRSVRSCSRSGWGPRRSSAGWSWCSAWPSARASCACPGAGPRPLRRRPARPGPAAREASRPPAISYREGMPSLDQPSSPTGPGTSAPAGRAVQVLDRARAALLDDPTGARDLRPVETACLDVTSAHPSGQAHLLASGRQKLSGLVRDPEARVAAMGQLRRFREVVGALDDRGLRAGHLVAGVVVLPGGSELPVLLRPCRVAGGGDGDASVVVDGPVALNPALSRELARRSAGALDLPSVLGDRLRTSGGGFDPYPLLDLVQAALPAVPGAVLRRRLLLAPVSLDGDRVVADLDRLRAVVPAGSPLSWVGEDWDVEPADLLARAGTDLPVLDEPEQGVADLLDRFSPTRLDPDQRRVLAAVLTGHSLAVDAPPGSGATTCAAAVASVAAATGRRCLVLVPTRAEGDVLVDRLVGLGLGDLVSDGSGQPASPTGTAARTAAAVAGSASGAVPGVSAEESARRHVEAGERYRAAVAELRRTRRPWQVTRARVLEVLAEAAVEGPRLTDVVLAQDPGTALSREQMEALADDLAEAVRLGSLVPTETVWTGARITDRQGAQEALGLAARLRDDLVREAVTATGDLAQGTGTVRAVTVADVTERHRLFSGLQTTLDRLVPEVFDVPVLDLVAATAEEEFRRTTGYTLTGPQRWRLQRRARRLVRPGVEVDDRQLHRLLSAAAAQRLDWQKISEGSGWAHLPASTGATVDRLGELLRACERLDLLHPGLRLADRPLAQLQDVAVRLLEEADALDDLPRRTLLEQRVSERGGSGLLARLRRLPQGAVTPEGAARELRLAWWTGVAEATAPSLSDRAATAEAAERYVASQRDWVAAAPSRVRAARETVDPRARLADPIRVLVPADVAALPLDEQLDVVVLDDAGRSGFAETCGATARTAQVVAIGDLGVARPGSALTVLGGGLPLDRLGTGHRTPEPGLAGLAAVTGSTPVRSTGSPTARPAVTRTFVEGAVGLPEGDAEQVESTEVEVDHVVRETLRLVADLAAADPPRSVAVIALTRAHAAAVAGGVRRAVRAYPDLAEAFGSAVAEPVVVASVDQTRGLERDEVLLTTGFARTPHGRVLHRFGPLDGPGGAGLMTTAVSRARQRLHVVTGLRARDLDPARLRTPGAVALARTLAAVEVAAGEGRSRRPVDRAGGRSVDLAASTAEPVVDAVLEAGAGGPVSAPGSRSAVLQVLALEMEELGAQVAPGPGGGLAVARAGRAPWLVVDVDVEQPDPGVLAGRRSDLVAAGWQHRLVAAELVAADVAGVALGLVGPRPAEDPDAATDADDDGHGPDGDEHGPDGDGHGPDGDEHGPDGDGHGPDDGPAGPSDGPDDGRADGPDRQPEPQAAEARPSASHPSEAPSAVAPASGDPVVPRVSADDSDTGWGSRPHDEDDDERILRERPPHW